MMTITILDSCLTGIFAFETNQGKIILLNDHSFGEKSSIIMIPEHHRDAEISRSLSLWVGGSRAVVH